MQIFFNAKIYTMNPAQPTVEALVVGSRGKLRTVGNFDAFKTMTPGGRYIDLGGRTILPGFNDAHVHIWKLGLLLTVQVDARIDAAPTIPAISAQFRDRAASVAAGTWLLGRGYNEAQLPERRHPTRADLDAASADHPIALTRTCGHIIAANSLALHLAGIDRDTPDPAGGVIEHDAEGEPTGILKETAMGLLTRAIPDYDDETLAYAIRAATYHQMRYGITSATDPLLTPAHLRVYRALDADGDLAVRVNGLPIRRPDGGTETLPLPEKYLSDTFRVDTVKFFADGGLSSATAAVSTPYQVTGDLGVLRFDTADLTELMWEAHDAGYRIATHAIGDRALDQVIGVYEELHRRKPDTGLRHRIEHLGLPTADHLRRCAALNVIAVPQTIFLPALGAAFRRYLSAETLAGAYPVRAMLDAGLTVALSSDAPVVPDDNPIMGVKAALNRLDHEGNPIAADQAITLQEALYAYTMGGAIASGDADNRGSLEVGKWADMIVLNADPFMTPTTELGDIQVDQTYVGGQLVYER
ncbi:MAG: amidohydrolase [Chloroflexota bacterium]|nr:amidohydrolase [Chloroflexota bacterium]